MSYDFEDIIYSIEAGVATITINRAEKLNSVTAQSLQEIEAALDAAGKDPDVGVVVLTGTGEKAFCTGADVSWQFGNRVGFLHASGGDVAFNGNEIGIVTAPTFTSSEFEMRIRRDAAIGGSGPLMPGGTIRWMLETIDAPVRTESSIGNFGAESTYDSWKSEPELRFNILDFVGREWRIGSARWKNVSSVVRVDALRIQFDCR